MTENVLIPATLGIVTVVTVMIIAITVVYRRRMLPKAKQFLRDHFDELSLSDGLADYKTIGKGLAKYPQNKAEIEFLRKHIEGLGHVYKKDASQTAKAAATIAVAATMPSLAGIPATAAAISNATYVISRADLDREHRVDFLGIVTKKRNKK